MKKIIAFTLAEVLIVLGIIGVIAEMTIPSLAANTQKVQFLSGLKKGYTEWNQVLNALSSDAGSTGDLAGSGWFSLTYNDSTLGPEIVKYFKSAKVCGMASDNECMPKTAAQNIDGQYRSIFDNYGISGFTFMTKDGMSFLLDKDFSGPNCSDDWSAGGTGPMSRVCGQIVMDVNGPKAPNIWGRDLFWFHIVSGQGYSLYPFGGQEDVFEPWGEGLGGCTPTSTYGLNCAGRIMEEGWQMNY